MKKSLLVLLSLMLLAVSVPAHAMVRTGNTEYYLHMRRTYTYLYGKNDGLESPAFLNVMREDAGFGYDESVSYISSNKKY